MYIGTMTFIHTTRSTQTPTQVIIIGTTASPVPRTTPQTISIITYVNRNGIRVRIICSPISSTFASSANSMRIYFPNSKTTPLTRTALHIASTVPAPRHFLTRSILPAPKFCPENVETETPNAPMIIQNNPSILPYAVHAATVSVPKRFTVD